MSTSLISRRPTGEPATSRVESALCPAHAPTLMLVGGVPGAGKTTLLNLVRQERPDVLTLDSERVATGLARRLPAETPYRAYRLLTHLLHLLLSLWVVVRGPSRSRYSSVLVHDPATRSCRRGLTGQLARWRGWRTALVLIDVSFEQAMEGQRRRGRLVRGKAFGRHWNRWEDQRLRLAAASTDSSRAVELHWNVVRIVQRDGARAAVDAILAPPGTPATIPRPGADLCLRRVLAGVTTLVVLVAVSVGTELGQRMDDAAMRAVMASVDPGGWADLVLTVVSPVSALLGALLVSLAAAWGGEVRRAWASLGVAAATMVAAGVMKSLLVRPDLVVVASNSFPSGHVAAAAALGAALWIALPPFARGAALYGTVLPGVALTGLAVMVLGWHRPSDVLGSLLIAFVITLSADHYLSHGLRRSQIPASTTAQRCHRTERPTRARNRA